MLKEDGSSLDASQDTVTVPVEVASSSGFIVRAATQATKARRLAAARILNCVWGVVERVTVGGKGGETARKRTRRPTGKRSLATS